MGELASVIIAEGQERGYHQIQGARARRLLNTALSKVCGWEAWPFLRVVDVEPALAATGIVTLTAEPRLIHGVYEGAAGSERPLGYLSGGHLKARYPSLITAASALPGRAEQFTAMYGGLALDELRIVPCQGGERIVVEFTRQAAKITADADPVDVPERYSDVVVDAWVLEAAKDQHDWETVVGLRSELVEQRLRMTEELLDAQVSDHDEILVVMGDVYE